MNKAELVEYVATQTEMTKADAQRAVEAVFEGITKTLKKGDAARFVGFGTFSVAKRAAKLLKMLNSKLVKSLKKQLTSNSCYQKIILRSRFL